MKTKKKENQKSTEKKDYDAKAEGIYPDDSKYPVGEQGKTSKKDPEENYQTESAGKLPADDMDNPENSAERLKDKFNKRNERKYNNTGSAVRDQELNEIEEHDYVNDNDEQVEDKIKDADRNSKSEIPISK